MAFLEVPSSQLFARSRSFGLYADLDEEDACLHGQQRAEHEAESYPERLSSLDASWGYGDGSDPRVLHGASLLLCRNALISCRIESYSHSSSWCCGIPLFVRWLPAFAKASGKRKRKMRKTVVEHGSTCN